MDQYVGEIRLFAGNYAPLNWAICDGALLPIAKYKELFLVIGTRYGGDGVQTFALPNFQGMAAMGSGAGSGLTPRTLGSATGVKEVKLRLDQMPRHSHVPRASNKSSNGSNYPTYSIWGGRPPIPAVNRAYSTSCDTSMAADVLRPVGDSQPHHNMQPYVTLNFIIALEGTQPTNG